MIRKLIFVFLVFLSFFVFVYGDFLTYSFPESFISEDEFIGEVVIGKDAILDRNTARDFLKEVEDLSFESNVEENIDVGEKRVKIVYSGSVNLGDDRLDGVRSNNELNYGEVLGDVSETSGFDDSDSNFLDDENFKNGISDESYSQNLKLENGRFNYALREDVKDVDEIKSGIYYKDQDVFAVYTIEFDTAIDLSDSDDFKEDMIGSKIMIMGNEFTIISISRDNKDLDRLELIGGGAYSVSVKEDEIKTVELENKTIEIEVKSVSEDKVFLDIDGRDYSLDLYDVREIDGVSIGIVDLFESSRESVSGYAQIIVGGHLILLEDEFRIVRVNDDDINDVYDDYEVESDFSDDGDGMKKIVIRYKVNDDILLEEGDNLEDVLFNSFRIHFESLNDVNYESVEINVNDDVIEVDGQLRGKDKLSRDMIFTNTSNGVNGVTYFKGVDDEDRIFFKGSDLDLYLPEGFEKFSPNVVELNFTNNNLKGSGFLMSESFDEQYLYEIKSVDVSDITIDIEDIFEDRIDEEVEPSNFVDEIDLSLSNDVFDDDIGFLRLDMNEFGEPIIVFENELVLDFTNVESSGVSGYINVYYDDIKADEVDDENEEFRVNFGWDASDDEFDLTIDKNDVDFQNSGVSDESDRNSDDQIYVTRYGTLIEYDNDENSKIRIRAPDDQIEAKVDIVFGSDMRKQTRSVFVDESDVDEKIEDLKDNGYTIESVEEGVFSYEDINVVLDEYVYDRDIKDLRNKIIIGGPAINKAAADILGIDFPSFGEDSGLREGEAIIKYFDEYDSVLIYGWEREDTSKAVKIFLEEDLDNDEVYIRTG